MILPPRLKIQPLTQNVDRFTPFPRDHSYQFAAKSAHPFFIALSYATARLNDRLCIRPSVRLSVCLSVRHTQIIRLMIVGSCGLHNRVAQALYTRDVHGNGNSWDPMGPMGFPWGMGVTMTIIMGMGVEIKVWEWE